MKCRVYYYTDEIDKFLEGEMVLAEDLVDYGKLAVGVVEGATERECRIKADNKFGSDNIYLVAVMPETLERIKWNTF